MLQRSINGEFLEDRMPTKEYDSDHLKSFIIPQDFPSLNLHIARLRVPPFPATVSTKRFMRRSQPPMIEQLRCNL
jgi:hypothetical protein